MENTILNVTLDIDAFVIPNSASKINLDYSFGTRAAERIERIAEINGFEFDRENDKLVQLWFVGKESCGSENLQDHGFHVGIDGYNYYFGAGIVPSFLPPVIFDGKKEGDVISVTIPLKPNRTYDLPIEEMLDMDRKEMRSHVVFFDEEGEGGNGPEVFITFNIRLNQRDYRYRSFGDFEDVVARVCHR